MQVLRIFLSYVCIQKTIGGLAQSEERNVSNVEAPGSKPGFSTANNFFLYAVSLQCDNNDASLA